MSDTEVTADNLTDEQIHVFRPWAYDGKFYGDINEQLDCYRADGSLTTHPDVRHAARQRIADAINARAKAVR